MKREKIIRSMTDGINTDVYPFAMHAIPCNDAFAYTNGSIVFTDKDNIVDYPILPTHMQERFSKSIAGYLSGELKRTIKIDRKALDHFIKENKMRYSGGKLIILKNGKEHYAFNAKWLWWLLDYAKTDIIDLVDCGHGGYSAAKTTGKDCTCLLLPVRLPDVFPEDIVFSCGGAENETLDH